MSSEWRCHDLLPAFIVLYDVVCKACVAPLIEACGKVWGSTGRVPVSAAVVLGLSWQRPDALVQDLLTI
jgi:hypothetical protein